MANASELAKSLPGFFTVDEAREFASDNVFTITFAEVTEVGQGAKAEDKPVLGFADTKKRLVLSKGRCNQLTSLFGDDDLIGNKISLSVDRLQGIDQIVISAPE